MQQAPPRDTTVTPAPTALENYYDLHARIYDATRWSFLFGRDDLLNHIKRTPRRILEVGCGTGKNLIALHRRFPQASITGVDLSDSMLNVARRKCTPFSRNITLQRACYNAPIHPDEPFDLIVFSYALSMVNPGYAAAIEAAHADLAPGGTLAVVDFHATSTPWFERWMGVNHVRMNGQLRPLLVSQFDPQTDEIRSAYWGFWQYLVFVGRKPEVPNPTSPVPPSF
ncbi:MAG: methyltransferase domain-containing protein [Verrucomicrobiota bacterium]